MEEHEHQTNFRNVPFNEETGFTRSEPMDLAIDALLKREVHPGPYSMNAHDYTMPTNLHPDWDEWVDEFMDDGIIDPETPVDWSKPPYEI